MNERIKELAELARIKIKPKLVGGVEYDYKAVSGSDELEKFAMLVIQDYENDKRESRRGVMSELGYSRIGRNNV